MIQQVDLAARPVEMAGTDNAAPQGQPAVSQTAFSPQTTMETKEKINWLAAKQEKLEKRFNPLKEMLEQIREMRKELDKFLNMRREILS